MRVSIEFVSELMERAADEQNDDACVQLLKLVDSDLEAREIYLRLLWLECHLPVSSSLLLQRVHQSQDVSAPLNGESTDKVSLPVNASAKSSDDYNWLGSIEREFSFSRITVLAASIVVLAAVSWMLLRSTQNQQVVSQNDSEVAKPTSSDAEDRRAVPLEKSPREPVFNTGFNNLSHPPKSGKILGGVLEDEEPLPDKISFSFHVRPILSENCFFCHGPDQNHREAGLRLDTERGYLDAVEPGLPNESELIFRIFETDEDIVMPPPHSGRTISNRQKEILKRWIKQGASYENHWAYVAPEKPTVPAVEDKNWPRNPIDYFVLSELERRGITPSPRAEPRTLVRRLFLDLIGLPPHPRQSETFVRDYADDPERAIETVVDLLLADPHYGERMAMPWLDAARYSDSNGFQEDGDRSQWPWRDWVVNALNNNMPFSQFTIEQLAGDLLPDPTMDQQIATAFNRNHMLNGEGGALPEEQRNNYVFDRVDTTATTWLGLTMACAQCHDHKYDPITQVDYYQFAAYFNTIDERGGVDRKLGRSMCAKPFIEMPTAEQEQAVAQINKELAPVKKALRDADAEITKEMRAWEVEARKNPAPRNMGRGIYNSLVKLPKERSKGAERDLKNWYLRFATSNEAWRKLYKDDQQLEEKKKKAREKILTVMVMREQKKPRATYVLERGDYQSPGEKVVAGVPHFLPPPTEGKKQGESTRLDLAKWLISDANPLTSRVQVNRYWQLFFGTGLVKTSEDFGVQGELPSHPELLDWLAVDFRENGWDIKRIHRMIVTSETYLQSSRHRMELVEIDAENRLLARGTRFRLPSFLIRDAALSVSGLLNPEIGGSPVYPYQPERLWREFSLEKFGYQSSTGKDLYRRSLYTFWRRTVPPPNMFDSSNRQTCTVKLSLTNTPLQALTLLNDPTYVETACHLALEMLSNPKLNDKQRLQRSFFRAVGRKPSETELESLALAHQESRDYYSENPEQAKLYIAIGPSIAMPEQKEELVELSALSSVVQVILNTDEFMTRE